MDPWTIAGLVVAAVVLVIVTAVVTKHMNKPLPTDSGGSNGSNSLVQNSSNTKSVDARKQKKQDELYSIPKRKKGHFILFNMYEFIDGERREGSNEDAEKLVKLFTDLGFEVLDYHNLTKLEILEQLQRIVIAQEEHYSCLALAILSHGSQCGFISADRQFIRTESVLNFFSNTNCPALADKPKMVFIQACQTSDIPDTSDTNVGLLVDVKPEITLDTKLVEMKPDFILAVATTLGHLAYRRAGVGSYFVQSLDRILRKFANDEEIHMLLLKVRKAVQAEVNQIPVVKSTLMRELYLNPPW